MSEDKVPTTSVGKSAGTQTNAYSGTGQTQPGGGGQDVFAAVQTLSRGGMRGIGLVIAILAEIVLRNKAIDIAKDYYRTNKKDYDYFDAMHSGPMAQSAAEAFGSSNPNYIEDKYASIPGGMAKSGILDAQWYETRRRIPKYNIGQQAKLDYEMALARTAGMVAGWNIANRYEINWADERNNRAFKRKVEIANIGIGVGNIVRDGMARATQNLASAYDGIGDTIATIGNGYAAKSAYNDARRDVKQAFKNRTEGTP